MGRKRTEWSKVVEKATKIHDGLYTYLGEETISGTRYVKYECPVCTMVATQNMGAHLSGRGCSCRKSSHCRI